MKKAILLSIALFAAFGLSGCSYNDLTAKQQQVKGKWANVESAMQRRADLIPNSAEIAKMTAIQEQEVFGQIADARSKLLNAQQAAPAGANGDKTPEQKQAIIDANNSFGGTIGRLLSLQENYPQLRSNEAFMKLQDELSGTENRINTARLDFNDAVTSYNTTRNSFPAVLTAGLLGFKEEPFFQAEPAAKTAPSVGDANSMRKPQTAAPAAPSAPAAPANSAPVKP
ncbi:MAG: LemA family protein [Pyrinomonadaceae bacterium]|nr:LemA family protein [Pyrinomonadaceae bacterium]